MGQGQCRGAGAVPRARRRTDRRDPRRLTAQARIDSVALTSPADTKSLIETAVTRFLEDVPALAPLKLVAGLELRGGRDIQMYRVELPGPKVTKDIATDAKLRLEIPRAKFNDLATKGHIKEWRAAFEHGDAKVTGIDQIIKLIANVVERQEERARTRHAKTH